MKTTTSTAEKQGKIHYFTIDDATKYGMRKAVLLSNLRYWLDWGMANERNVYDGFVWTFNSVKAFSKLFPYITEDQIDRDLRDLEKEGVIMTGNFNKKAYDRTKWYTIPQEYGMDSAELRNGFRENAEPIPNINPNINTDIPLSSESGLPHSKKPTKKEEQEEEITDSDEIENDITYDSDVDDDGNPKTNSFGRYASGKSIHKKLPSARNKDAVNLEVWFAKEVQKNVSSTVPIQVKGYSKIKELLEKKNGLTVAQIKEVLQAHLDKGYSDLDTSNIYKALSASAINAYFNE